MTRAVRPGLGTMTLTGAYGGVDAQRATTVLGYAVQQGVALLDTADVYPGGEEIVATVRAAHPEHPFRVATKVGLTGPPGRRSTNGRPSYLARACEASIRRLDVEQLDILLLHRADLEIPIEDSMSALAAAAQEGKVAEIGLCTNDPELLRRAASVAPVSYVQAALSVLSPEAAQTLLPIARDLGVTMLAFNPLGRGLAVSDLDPSALTRDDARAHMPEIDMPRRLHATNFRRFAGHLGMPAADLALGWINSLGPDVIPIPGARSMSQVTQNLNGQRRDLSSDALRSVQDFVRNGAANTFGADHQFFGTDGSKVTDEFGSNAAGQSFG